MSDMRNDGTPREPYHKPRVKGRLIAILALLVLALSIYAMAPDRGEIRTADTSAGTTSGANNPPPAPPREREPQGR